MSTVLTISSLKRHLYGTTIPTKAADGSKVTIHIPSEQPPGWPRRGSEAYGLVTQVEVERGGITSTTNAFLKLFFKDVPERARRTVGLIQSKLASESEYFHGVPFGWIGTISKDELKVSAHFTRMIDGPFDGKPEDFGRLRDTGRWTYDERQRRTFAAELACAVSGLESAGVVHGDISPANILVGANAEGKAICILCDYDGFHHSGVPRLPRRFDNQPCRPMGSAGYQYPQLVKAIQKDTDSLADIYVETDRFALAVAICEMMLWSPELEQHLVAAGTDRLVDEGSLLKGNLEKLPPDFITRFPVGMAMLQRAMISARIEDMPAPEEWLRILGYDEVRTFAGQPMIRAFRARGNSREKLGTFKLKSDEIPFGKLGLEGVEGHMQFRGGRLEMVAGDTSIMRRRDGKLSSLTTVISTVSMNPGDTFHIGPYVLDIQDTGSDAANMADAPEHAT